jgi:hypothetical protein
VHVNQNQICGFVKREYQIHFVSFRFPAEASTASTLMRIHFVVCGNEFHAEYNSLTGIQTFKPLCNRNQVHVQGYVISSERH